MDRGRTGLADFQAELVGLERTAYVRALLHRTDDGWALYHVRAIVGEEPSGWLDEVWEYKQLVFVAQTMPARNLAILSSQSPGEVRFGHLAANSVGASGAATWVRRPSFARHDQAPLAWPTVEYSINAADSGTRGLPGDMLVGRDCPSFPESFSAWRAFSERDFSLAGAGAPPAELAKIRIIQSAGWIGSVHVTPTQLISEVHGTDLADCQLELYGMTDRAVKRVAEPCGVVFPLDRGLPEDAWLWLKRGTTWLDYRPIDPRSGWAWNLEAAGVEIETPIDPQANVEALISAGEGPSVEYKEKLPTTPKERRTAFKTVAAFATGDGGTIVFGINRDESTITGLEGGNAQQLRDQLLSLIRATVIPTPQVIVSHYTVEGKSILVAQVEPGQSAPYGVIPNTDSRDKPEFYVRRGASTYPAQPGELREAALNRPRTAETSSRSGRFGLL